MSSGARPATRCTRTPRCWASWRSRWPPRSPSSSTPRCGSARAAGRRAPCPRPTAPARLSRRSTCARHEAVAEHSDGRTRRVPLTPDRPVGEVTRELLAAVGELGGPVEINTDAAGGGVERAAGRGQRARRYDTVRSSTYFAAATHAALVLAAFRAPYRGRSTPVNAWWGSFDLAVSLFSGLPAEPPRATSSCATRWTPRRSRSAGGRATPLRPRRVLRLCTPGARGLRAATLSPAAARWERELGEYVLDWDDVRASSDPHAFALEFLRSAFNHACWYAGGIPRCRPVRKAPRPLSAEAPAMGAAPGPRSAGGPRCNAGAPGRTDSCDRKLHPEALPRAPIDTRRARLR